MANTFISVKQIAREALPRLIDNLVFPNLIYKENIEGYATLSRKIAGVELGMVLREKDNGAYKVSMRSRKSVNSAALCALFGGGGHVRAAGATIEADSFGEASQKLLDGVMENIVFEG